MGAISDFVPMLIPSEKLSVKQIRRMLIELGAICRYVVLPALQYAVMTV